ncbi:MULTISPECIES: molybdate ABC transporter substrate-binding protein [Microbulbifer]|uniref:molybdate ABC transporter substrate-binding protein n=1 Tax=Microbulbifer TaxID=48073 RepID=UPI001E5C18EC|nr:molybdate ABC transporter substrate-binding protein [Microbulbifer sp. YPW16]UHQ56535.1 molybdate ABC transporter substrate-binding protein [Microbulbifer sp. YPW16]
MGLIRALAVLGALLALALPAGADDCRLKVAVAASFRPALETLLPEFEAATRCRVVLTSGSSGALYQQALHGAPFDLFLSADRQRPGLLERQGRIVPGSRRTYARGLLALWLPDTGGGSEALLRRWRDTLVLADPEVAPFGVAARQVLQSLGLWEAGGARLARAHNAGHAFMLLESGHARLGFVAASQMTAAGRNNVWLIPQDLYEPIEQQLVVLRHARSPSMAEALADFLASDDTRQRLVALGYGPGAGKGL